MIKEIIKNSSPQYGKYFLSMEADEEVAGEDIFKPNTRVIVVKPRNNRIDFYDDFSVDPELPVEEPPTEEPPASEPAEGDTQDSEVPETDNPEDGAPTDGEEPSDVMNDVNDVNTEIDSNASNLEDVPGTDVEFDGTAPEGYENDVQPTDQDINADGIPDSPIDTNNDGTPDSLDTNGDGVPDSPITNPNMPNGTGPGLEYDSTRKYNLFLNYISLYNAVTNYIHKLENQYYDDRELTQKNTAMIIKLKKVKDLCYDFMTLKYENSTYFQSLLFYQNLVITVQLIFSLNKNKK